MREWDRHAELNLQDSLLAVVSKGLKLTAFKRRHTINE
jgi:hypothetical protein